MRGKTGFVVILVGLLMVALLLARAQNGVPAVPGRYQIQSVHFRNVSMDGSSMTEIYTIMKIDTSTGQTWLYTSAKDNGHLSQQWLPATNP